jgi:hypothetical protein
MFCQVCFFICQIKIKSAHIYNDLRIKSAHPRFARYCVRMRKVEDSSFSFTIYWFSWCKISNNGIGL